MGNTWPSRTCVINEYQYFTMSLSKNHGWCQYHNSMSIWSKTVKKTKVKKGQERSIQSKTINMVKTGQKQSKNVKSDRKRSQMVKNGNKMVKQSWY